jgi:signal transduction histidine kinase
MSRAALRLPFWQASKAWSECGLARQAMKSLSSSIIRLQPGCDESGELAEAAPESTLAADVSSLHAGTDRIVSKWMGWRMRLLVLAALLGCLGPWVLARWMAEFPRIDASWRLTSDGQIQLDATADPQLKPHLGQMLLALSSPNDGSLGMDASLLQGSPRWLTDDTERARYVALNARVQAMLSNGDVTVHFANGEVVHVKPVPHGLGHLGLAFWSICALSMALYLVGMVVALARPSLANSLYALMAFFQAGNLLAIAVQSTLGLSLPAPIAHLDMPIRSMLDVVTAIAAVHAACVNPIRIKGAGWIAGALWSSAAFWMVAVLRGWLPELWWWTQSVVVGLSFVGVGLLTWSHRQAPHPGALVLRRFGLTALATWLLLTAALAAADHAPDLRHQIAAIGPLLWYVFFASLLLLVPFLSKSQQVMREFSLLAVISTVATSLDLLFVAVFSLGQFTSLTLALFLSLAGYTGARQWLMNRLMGRSMLTTERMFDNLYRVAREVEVEPTRLPALLQRLLQTLFEPLEIRVLDRRCRVPRVVEGGATMLVPIPDLEDPEHRPRQLIAMRFSQRGRSLFTQEDVRLTDRILDQLSRAVAFDKAVEQGRKEERLRLAQDLHDDIGARLLTLMYTAPSSEMEDYVRYTLHDLKTLTRGLAASQHRLSHAAVEWKTDLGQRLSAAHIGFGWHFNFDQDILLNVVQWSALTRIMRELVSNSIAHANASRVDIHFRLAGETVDLSVTDDGSGQNPQTWAHGLGLGGVRKRAKQLDGEVTWREVPPCGTQCRVFIPKLFERGT